jgi:hypothetical protein
MHSDTLVAVFFLAGVMTVIAQQKPDFSGEWTLNRQASTLSPKVAPVAQSGVLRIEHHEPKFKAHQTIVLDASRSSLISSFCQMVAKLSRTREDAGSCPPCAGTETR